MDIVRSHQGSPASQSGRKRAREHPTTASSSLSPVPDDLYPPKIKKPKRAETRPCPACSEHIPIRLLSTHAELEKQRVEDIIKHIGDAEVLTRSDDLDYGEGPSAHKRRSALKARRSLTALQPSPRIDATTSPAAIENAIGYITRRRRARHTRLKELAKEDATWLTGGLGGAVCPVCLQFIRGEGDVVEAHVDACLAYESRRARIERGRGRTVGLARGNKDAEWDEAGERVITDESLRGTGIHIRPSTVDTEDDIDIDGTDDAVFGNAQFGEADVVDAKMAADVEDIGRRTDHDRHSDAGSPTGIQGPDDDTDRLELAILTARSQGDNVALVMALEAKLNTLPAAATCRVCLSPYVDPTVSTGCWHTCCATCWLRCLGATKLCPMCQRITGAAELRKVYL